MALVKDSPNFLYSTRIAENAWERIVNGMGDRDIIEVDEGERTLDKTLVERIIKFLGGNFIDFSDGLNLTDEEKEYEKAKEKMGKYIQDNYSQKEVEADSYFVRISDDYNFEIGYIKFKLMSVIHELGHAFLELKNAELKCLNWNDGSISKSENMTNAFARAFVMPRERFLKKVSENSKRGRCDILSVAKSFGVDYTHAYIRGKELHLWD